MNTNAIALSQIGLRDIDDVKSRTEADEVLFRELRAVLEKHGAQSRFGVTLLHRHFDVYEDEVLVESCDLENRTLTCKPVKVSQILGLKLKETNWRLDTDQATSGCTAYCPEQDSRHLGEIHT